MIKGREGKGERINPKRGVLHLHRGKLFSFFLKAVADAAAIHTTRISFHVLISLEGNRFLNKNGRQADH